MESPQLDPSDDLHVIAAAQRLELSSAVSAESDLDLAFHLQLQEALSASLSLLPSSSSSSPPPPPLATSPPEPPSSSSSLLQADLLDSFLLERRDSLLAEAESRRATETLLRLAHDRHVASQISLIPDPEWAESGDHFHRPFAESTTTNINNNNNNNNGLEFRIYCKGMVGGDEGMGVGVAVCDWGENVVFEMSKPMPAAVGEKSRVAVEMKAVVEGLTAAVALGLKRVVFCFDHYPVYQYIVGRWTPKQRKIVVLVNHVNQLREKFEVSTPSLVAGNDIKFATKLAREAIVSQLNRPSESTSVKSMNESCDICLEDKDVSQFFAVDICSHRYCFSCMKQHVEVKLLHGMVAKCPHEDCNSELKIESCKLFLTPKLIDMMTHRLKEASIPVTEKVYCPYPKCSFLMTKNEVLEYSRKTVSVNRSGIRKCTKCEDFFCIYCKVPWHNNMSCCDYKRKNPYPRTEDAKLKTLANQNLWRQCVKCNHMIELDAGCYHMTCRCGYEFCYTCGAEWKNKKATCSCPLWDEYNIMDQDYERDEDIYDFDDEDYDTDFDRFY